MTRNSSSFVIINRTTTRKQKLEEEELYGYFKGPNGKISYKKTWARLKKGSVKRKTEFLLIAGKKICNKDQLAKSENKQHETK